MGLAADDSPQLVIRHDGEIYTTGPQQNSAAPLEWTFKGDEEASRFLKLGNWYIGDKASSHFVIHRVGASTPQFLLRGDGNLWVDTQDGPPPASFVMAAPWCQDADVAKYGTSFQDTAWTVASKSGNAVISRAGAASPSLVLTETFTTVNFKASVLAGRQLKATDPNVVTLGGWLIGFHDDVFVINTVANKGANWPQFALDASGTMYARTSTGSAGVGWSISASDTSAQVVRCWALESARSLEHANSLFAASLWGLAFCSQRQRSHRYCACRRSSTKACCSLADHVSTTANSCF